MAKFKVGDVVSVSREAAEMIGNPALARKRGRVTKVLPGGYYEVDGELGATGLELTDAELTLANSRACNVRSRNEVVAKALNACGTARNAGAYDVAAQAGNLFRDAYNALAGCAASLERLTTLGQPNDVPGNDNKIVSWAKEKARKVRDLMNKLDQGRL